MGQTNCTNNPDFANPLRRKAIDAAIVKAVSAGIHKKIWYNSDSASIVRGKRDMTVVRNGIAIKVMRAFAAMEILSSGV